MKYDCLLIVLLCLTGCLNTLGQTPEPASVPAADTPETAPQNEPASNRVDPSNAGDQTGATGASHAAGAEPSRAASIGEALREGFQNVRADLDRLNARVDALRHSVESHSDQVQQTFAAIAEQQAQLGRALAANGQQRDRAESPSPGQEGTAQQGPSPQGTGWTGALVYADLDGQCPPCLRLVRDIQQARGWRIGRTGDCHFLLRTPTPEIRREGVPYIEFIHNGTLVATQRGYNGNLRALLEKHPLARPSSAPTGQSRLQHRRGPSAVRHLRELSACPENPKTRGWPAVGAQRNPGKSVRGFPSVQPRPPKFRISGHALSRTVEPSLRGVRR